MACLGAILEASRAVLGGRAPQQTRTSKSVQNLRQICVFLSLGALLEGLLEPPGASWGILDGLGRLLASLTLSGAVLGASLGRLCALLQRFWAVLGPSCELFGRSWGRLGPTRGPFGSLMGCLGAILEAFRAVLSGRNPKQARTSNSF